MNAPTGSSSDLSFDQLLELDRRAAERAAERAGGGDGLAGDDDLPDEPGDESGDAIVLPWWQHPVNIVTMVVTAAILAAMVGWMVGDNGSSPAHNEVDTGFLQDMREHHEQAVLMSFIYRTRDDLDPGLNVIAREIIVGQSLEVGRMIQMLRGFGESEINESDTSMLWMSMVAEPGKMPGMATQDELDELGRLDGAAADELYVELMTAHHLGGIEMAEFAVANAENDEVVAMAASMINGQRGEIQEMADRLASGS
jgi:uncharacterized protein (DUF305 family)